MYCTNCGKEVEHDAKFCVSCGYKIETEEKDASIIEEKQPEKMEDALSIEEKIKIESQLNSGADWFFWIAGLSLINSIIILSGSDWGFIIGLGTTQIIDGIAIYDGTIDKSFAFILDVIVASVFIVFGIFARKRNNWSFITGMILYGLDGLLFFIVNDYLGIGFHIFALYCIYGGLKANGQLSKMEPEL